MGMMQGLDPVMETIVDDLNKVTDFSKMNRLNDKWDLSHGGEYGNINASGAVSDGDTDGEISDGDNSDADKAVEKSLKKNTKSVSAVKDKLKSSL